MTTTTTPDVIDWASDVPADFDPSVLPDRDEVGAYARFDLPPLDMGLPTLFDGLAPLDEEGNAILQPDRLRAVLGLIEENPSLWKQGTWHCGTAGCFAGLTADLAGATWGRTGYFNNSGKIRVNTDVVAVLPGGWTRIASSAAQDLLGLTDDQADALFNGDNDLDDLRKGVEAIIAGKNLRCEYNFATGQRDLIIDDEQNEVSA